METKICSKCGPQPIDQFGIQCTISGTLKPICKKCARECKAQWRKTHSGKQHRRQEYANKRSKIRSAINVHKANGCVCCGEKELCCLDFHHLGDKTANVHDLKSQNMALKEIAKCIVVCSNCHRKLHAGLISTPELNEGK